VELSAQALQDIQTSFLTFAVSSPPLLSKQFDKLFNAGVVGTLTQLLSACALAEAQKTSS
jgi:hypothetical protein